jgi:hypothetical protein
MKSFTLPLLKSHHYFNWQHLYLIKNMVVNIFYINFLQVPNDPVILVSTKSFWFLEHYAFCPIKIHDKRASTLAGI